MKNQLMTIAPMEHDPKLENLMHSKHAGLKDLAQKNARHFAKRNLPAPSGDQLPPYIGDITSGYEHLATEIFHNRQPSVHFPEAKIDAEHLREKVSRLADDIKTREDQNHRDEYDLGNYHPGSIPLRLWVAGIATSIITIGEVVFNTKAFQITGESMLFALIISISISFGILAASHIAAFLYKGASTVFKRRLVIWCSLLLVSGVFIALAMLRSRYLASHEVDVSPGYFVVFNLFFFIVSSLLSLFLLPTLEEIKLQLKHIKLFRAVKKRKVEIERLKGEINGIKEVILANTKYRLRETYYANYAAERIRKMHGESIGAFKAMNLISRTDGQTPDCFSQNIPEPRIEDITIAFLSNSESS